MPLHLAIGAFFLAGFAAYAITPFTSKLAHRFGILDHPDDGRKAHRMPTPYLGGVAIIFGTVLGAAFLRLMADLAMAEVIGDFSIGVLLATTLGVVGLVDDVRPLPRLVRLAAQVGAALVAWEIGFQITATSSEALNIALTLFWIVGITNAFNLLDNMDGLSAGLAGVSAFSFAVMGVVGDLPVLTIVAAALAGSALGFLGHNRHPARVFMGDAGSLFLGFLLALIGIEMRFDNLVEVTFLVPVVVLGLPIFDTTLVIASRLRHGRGVFEGGRDHVSHRLVRVGLPVKAAVGLLYWSGLCLGWLGLAVSRSSVEVGWMLLGFVIALGLFFGVLLWEVPVYEEDTPALPELPEEAVDPDSIFGAAKEHASTG